jgi:hypothetical protein
MTTKTKILIGAFVLTAIVFGFIGAVLHNKFYPCPSIIDNTEEIKMLEVDIGRLTIQNSALEDSIAAGKQVIKELSANKKPISKQVKDAEKIARGMSVQSIADDLLAEPPSY